MPKLFTPEEFQIYLLSQDSFGDALYYCNEFHITKAIRDQIRQDVINELDYGNEDEIEENKEKINEEVDKRYKKKYV